MSGHYLLMQKMSSYVTNDQIKKKNPIVYEDEVNGHEKPIVNIVRKPLVETPAPLDPCNEQVISMLKTLTTVIVSVIIVPLTRPSSSTQPVVGTPPAAWQLWPGKDAHTHYMA